MIKLAVLYTAILSGTAFGILQYLPALLDYYYGVLALVGIIQCARTGPGGYTILAMVVAIVYGVENNGEIWHALRAETLTLLYFIAAFVVLILARVDDDLRAGEIVAGLLFLKWVVSFAYGNLYDSSYIYHTILNVLSIAQWVVIITMATRRIAINKGKTAWTKPHRPVLMAAFKELFLGIIRT